MRKLTLKAKLGLMGICALLLVVIFTFNVVRDYNNRNENIIVRDEEMITFKEVKHLLSFLGVGEGDYIYQNEKEVEERELPDEGAYLAFEDFSYIIPSIANKLDLDMNTVLEQVSFNIQDEKDRKAVLVAEFLEIYEAVINALPSENAPVKEEELFIVGIPDKYKDEADKEIMSTDKGVFEFANGLDYGSFYINGELIKEDNEIEMDKESDVKEKKQSNNREFHINDNIDRKITAIVAGDNLVYVRGILDDETILHNVWIAQAYEQTVNTFAHEVTKEYRTQSNLSEEINGVVGDLIIKDGEIAGIRIKPERIDGKVLVTDEEYIEVEGYGQIPLDENYKIYKIYGDLAQEMTNSILVGYETTDFIVAEGKIVAALIKEELKAENIRVLIKTNQFSDYYHKEVSFTSNVDFTVTSGASGENVVSHPAGTAITIASGEEALGQGRMTVKPASEGGKIQLLSLERSSGNPAYRGQVEIAPTESGLLIINELPLEEYLYGVVPSEMPSSYNIEALKSQAICARSYAYNHLITNSLKEYGGHVDDSVSFQVYNNIEENEETILAVKDTYGKIMTYEGAVINAYYFSTSSGHTASVGEVWSGEAPYLSGKLQIASSGDEVIEASTDTDVDFSNEEVYRNFILNPAEATYDSEVVWYRWNTTISFDEITNSINSKLASRYNANPEYIQTLVKNEGGEEVFESHPIESIGNVVDIQVITRQKSGIITELKLVGSEKTVKIIGEYNIRTLLSAENQTIVRKDSSEVSQSMLPSAFFVIDKTGSAITINGGGYGHGVGMSQNGAKAMADQGKGYEEILKHYYSGVEITYIY